LVALLLEMNLRDLDEISDDGEGRFVILIDNFSGLDLMDTRMSPNFTRSTSSGVTLHFSMPRWMLFMRLRTAVLTAGQEEDASKDRMSENFNEEHESSFIFRFD